MLVDGAIAGILAGAVCLGLPWARARFRFAVAGGATFLGFIAWNLVISHANASGLDVDAPVVALSWQDAGSGVLAFAATSLALGIYERNEKAGIVLLTAAVAGAAAMVWDVFVL